MPKEKSNIPTTAKVPERRVVTGTRTVTRKPVSSSSEKRPFGAGLAYLSFNQNPNLAKGLTIVLGIILAIAGMYFLTTSDFVMSRLEAPPPPPDDSGQ